MKKIYLIIGMLMLSSISQAQNKNDSIFGIYFNYLISKDGWYNYNECKGEISGNLFLMIFNEDSTFSSRVYSLSETCTFEVYRCDTTIGTFQHISNNELILTSSEQEVNSKIGSSPCNAFWETRFYVFKNKFSDFVNDEFAYNGFANYDKVIKREHDKMGIIDLKTFYRKEFTELNETYIKIEPLYKGVYYKFEVDKTEEGKIGVFKLLKLNDDKTFEYKLFQVYDKKVLKLDKETNISGTYEYLSENMIKISK